MHGEIVHQTADYVVCGSRVDRRSKIDKDCLGDIESQVVRIVTRDTPKDPSGGKNDTSPADKECNAPESIATIVGSNQYNANVECHCSRKTYIFCKVCRIKEIATSAANTAGKMWLGLYR
jgi:hypothetical protein